MSLEAENAVVYYLKEVLGIDALATPIPAKLLVLTALATTSQERELIQKMLSAIDQLPHFAIENEEIGSGFHFGLSFAVKMSANSNIRWLELPDIKSFFDESSAAAVKTLKKETWAKLQQFKNEMDTT